MIDKLTPKFLDKSSDYKLVRKTSLIDALNIYVDVETGGESTGGVIKPIKGTASVIVDPFDEQFVADTTYKAIGSVTDDNTGIAYFFVWSEDTSEHSIWAYDHRGVLPRFNPNTEEFAPGVRGRLRRIMSSREFNFPVNGFVKGDIVYSNTREFDKYEELKDLPYPQKDSILYFTDNRNEPRKINLYRAMLSGTPAVGTQDHRDFISACPRVPMDRPSFKFVSDPDRDVNNFATSPGFQFAYQNIYKDGMESAISPYSSMAFPPSIVDRGASSSDQTLAHNKCEITIPAQNTEVQSIKILARYGNGVNFIEIDEVENVPGEEFVFDFYNDRIAGGVSPQTVDKSFDNVPQRAQAQSVVSNRLVYGNYVEGYDNVDCTGVELSPVYLERPPEILDYYLEVKPSIEICSGGSQDPSTGNHKTPNKTMGFTYRTDEFSDFIPANTKVVVSLSMSPDKNFHFYDVGDVPHTSYHQSRQVGSLSLNLSGYNEEEVVDGSSASFQEENGYGEPGYLDDASAGGYFLKQSRENYFGYTQGLYNGQAKWKQTLATTNQSLSGTPRQIAFGTSAANPLIIRGGKLTFGVEFTVVNPVSSGGANFIGDMVEWLLEGRDQDFFDSQLGEGAITFDPDNIKRSHVHEFDLGLEEAYSPIPPSSDLGSLICGAGYTPFGDSNLDTYLDGKPPSCAFIVNRAKVGFYLQKSTDRLGTMNRAFSIGVGYVHVEDEEDVWTCIRDVDPASPWWAIPKSKMTGDLVTNPISEWENNLQVPNRVFRAMAASSPVAMTRNFTTNLVTQISGEEVENLLEQGGLGSKDTMEMCFGHLKITPDSTGGLNLLPFYRDIDEPTFSADEPIMPISMQDGEGGPGGAGAGEGSAYDVLECHKLGSIGAQAFIGVDEDHIEMLPGRGYVVYSKSADGELGSVGDESGQNALQYLVNGQLANALGIEESTGGGLPDGVYAQSSAFMGPFYTGKIVLNNIQFANDAIGNVNPTPLPKPMFGSSPRTTVLPLVMFSSFGRFNMNTGPTGGTEEEQGPLIKADPSLYEGLTLGQGREHWQVAYPYPIVEPGTGPEDGELVSGQVIQDPFGTGYNSVDFERTHSHMELNSSVTDYIVAGKGSSSFKTSATHEIGMVYYDERGRHGRVNHVGSVYIPGYGERNSLPKGRSLIQASNITHRPPSWAKKYKFVYSKNTSVDKFVQYSAGGAFVARSEYEGGTPTSIYVSLNYLQGHPISYSDSFGARGRDNTPVMYSFTPGDRLRVISYMLAQDGADINRVFPVGAEFEVTGLADFSSMDPSEHPFATEVDGTFEVSEDKKGLFVVLKNNNDATGFRYQSVDQGEDNWGNNCIFEIYSPVKEVDREDRLYYEIGEAYDVVYATAPIGHPEQGQLQHYHDFESVVLEDGDVYFRRHAVNLREFNGSDGFVDMLAAVDDEGNPIPAESNFKSYYLESEAATDLFPSRAISIGRPNIIDLDAKQTFREASLIHSDKDVVESRKLGYSSFNRTIPSDMEIDTKSGAINFLANHQDSIFFIQKTKCGHIPVDRTLIQDTSGSASLIASSRFLGTPRYYVGEAGCDNNPESVINVNNAAFFASKSAGKVFKVSGANGVNVISDKGVSEYIRNQFNAAVADSPNGVRVVGGYDPLKKEYLLTIIGNEFEASAGSYEDQEVVEGWRPQSYTIDVDGLESIDYIGEEVLPDDFTVGGNVEPGVSIDWNYSSNLSHNSQASWNLVYTPASEGSGLNGDYSTWSSSVSSISVPLVFDAEVVVKFDGAGQFNDSAPPSVKIELGSAFSGIDSFVVGNCSRNWDLGDLDNVEDISATRAALDAAGLLGTGPSLWNLQQVYSDSDITVDPGVDGPYSVTVTLNNPSQYTGVETVEKRVGVRFACMPSDDSIDFYSIINPFDLGNVEPVNGQFSGAMRVTSTNAEFKKGTLSNEQNQALVGLTGSIFVQEEAPYADFEVFIDTSEIDVPLDVAPFNPCHPEYGIFNLSLGVLTVPSVLDWLGSPLYSVWVLDTLGIEETTAEQDNALAASFIAGLDPFIGTELSCPNINYPDDAPTDSDL